MKNAKKIAWRRIASGLSVVGALGAFWVAAGAPPFAWIQAAVLLFPVAVGGGVLAGYAGGGRLRGLGALRLRAVAVLVAAVVLQLALPGGRGVVQYALITASYALVGGWLVVNLGRRAAVMRVGLGLLAAGWMLNLAPIAANGAMPVSLGALREVNPPLAEDLAGGELDKHVVAGSQTRLNGLGDIVPVAPFETVVSLGDIVMCIGIVLTTATGMASVRGCRRRTHREEESI